MHQLQAFTGRYIWVHPDNPGQPELGPHLTPDGVDVWDAVAAGDVRGLGFVPRFRRRGGGPHVGDLVWTGGTAIKIVSRRFVDVLRFVGAEGYRTFAIDLLDARGHPMDGFVGFANDLAPPRQAAVQPCHPWQTFRFLVTDDLHEALHRAGVTRFRSSRVG